MHAHMRRRAAGAVVSALLLCTSALQAIVYQADSTDTAVESRWVEAASPPVRVSTLDETLITSNTSLGPTDTAYEGRALVVSGATLTLSGAHTFASLVLTSGAVLTHPAAPYGESDNRIALAVTGDLVIDEGAQIQANGLGFTSNQGPGTPGAGSSSGAGHGGTGGRSSYAASAGSSYGSALSADSAGSGGSSATSYGEYPGGAGGGRIDLEVGGTLTVNGIIAANGTTGDLGGGGSGGSLRLSAASMVGSGSLRVNGGGGVYNPGSGLHAGGGAGGRILITCPSITFEGIMTADGGAGAQRGAPGTVAMKGHPTAPAIVYVSAPFAAEAWTPVDTAAGSDLVIGAGAICHASGHLLLRSLTVRTGGLFTHPPLSTGVHVTATDGIAVEPGGAISADAKGHPRATGPGSASYGGAGHGGSGGSMTSIGPGGPTYGSAEWPILPGSGGGTNENGGAGGGIIRITTAGTLQIDGTISADGADGSTTGWTYGSGGSGGSVLILAGAVSGSGQIRARGGSAYPSASPFHPGGGGGGRVAVYGDTSAFAGFSVAGGNGPDNGGGAGSLHLASSPPHVAVQSRVPEAGQPAWLGAFWLTLNQPVLAGTLDATDLAITGPAGAVPSAQVGLSSTDGLTWRVTLPPGAPEGTYSVSIGPDVTDLFGRTMPAAQSGIEVLSQLPPLGTRIVWSGPIPRLELDCRKGVRYRLQRTSDLVLWSNEGEFIDGTDSLRQWTIDLSTPPRVFYRLVAEPAASR